MNEKHYHDLLAGFALNCLDGEEHEVVERHLAECDDCRVECAELRETVHYCMGYAAPIARPSPLLRTQVLARIAVEMGPTMAATLPTQPATPAPPLITQDAARGGGKIGFQRRQPPARQQRYVWLLGGAAVPAALALVLGILFMHTQNQLNDERNAPLASAFDSPHVAMPLDGVAVRHGMRGEVIMPRTGKSGLVLVSGMHGVPSGMTYTCWLRQNGHWTPEGSLRPDASGIAMVVFDGKTDLHQADQVGVTMQRTAQPAAPLGPMLLSARL